MDQIWWNHIIKAHAFLENIVKEAAGGHSLLLTLPDSVPWKSTFLDLIREQLLMENPKNKLEVIECPEEEPGEFILQKYCKRETRAKYRYGVSYAQFLGKCQETVLNDRYVWVSDIPDEKVTKWLDFVSEYQKNVQDKTPGIFILEVHNDAMNRKSKKGVLSLGFEQKVEQYDEHIALYVTNTFVRTRFRYPHYMYEENWLFMRSLSDEEQQVYLRQFVLTIEKK